MNLTGEELKKWEFLRDAPQSDAHHPTLHKVAEALWEAALHVPRRYAELAHAVARDNVRFEGDIARVGHEDIAGLTRAPAPDDAIDALERGLDDCDAKARLFVALCLVVGLQAEMIGFEKTGELVHVAARVRLDGKWCEVETTLARARVGEPFTDVPKEKNGQWRVS